MRLTNKVAFITGSARGLGRATALRFAREGAKIAACDLTGDDAGLIAEVAAAGSTCLYQHCDVTQPQQVEAMVAACLRALGQIDILVNNAGIVRDATLLKMSEEQWQSVLDVNLGGVFHCTRAAAPHMVARRCGKIINMASIVGLYGNFGQTNYAAAKAGVVGLTRTWARELGPKGITVNAIAPGFIATDMVGQMPPEAVEKMKQRTPLQRLGAPEDIAAACAFLASPDADFINGAVLSVDGGLTL